MHFQGHSTPTVPLGGSAPGSLNFDSEGPGLGETEPTSRTMLRIPKCIPPCVSSTVTGNSKALEADCRANQGNARRCSLGQSRHKELHLRQLPRYDWLGCTAVVVLLLSALATPIAQADSVKLRRRDRLDKTDPMLNGDVTCPCFCSRRDATWSPYWSRTFGPPPLNAPTKCDSPCVAASDLHAASVLSLCEAYVATGSVCIRRFNETGAPGGTNHTNQQIFDYFQETDRHVLACETELPWDLNSQCGRATVAAACAFAFPRCVSNPMDAAAAATPLDVCDTLCVRERMSCRVSRVHGLRPHIDRVQ